MATPATSLRVQCVLFEQTQPLVERLVSAVAASARYLGSGGDRARVSLVLGDCSSSPILEHQGVASVRNLGSGSGLEGIEYEFFGANLGSAEGSNRLARSASEEFFLVLNPDTYPSPPLLARLLEAFKDPSVGCADARQIPLEHPKEYDLLTGETSWASGSCLMVRTNTFHALGGFDPAHFFLYCDDVDFSWRVRLSGSRVVHVPDAVVFHDKRIDTKGRVRPTALEDYHGLLGRLMLAQRYQRPDIISETLDHVRRSGSEDQRRAADEWNRRWREGSVPEPLPGAEAVAQFIDGEYAKHRF